MLFSLIILLRNRTVGQGLPEMMQSVALICLCSVACWWLKGVRFWQNAH